MPNIPISRTIIALSVILVFLLSRTGNAQQTPEELGLLWINAIKTHSIEEIKPLMHPNCPKASIKLDILERMVAGELPSKFIIETKDLGPKNILEMVYEVIPDKQLNFNFVTGTAQEKKRFGLGKGFPIAKLNNQWFFVLCQKPNT